MKNILYIAIFMFSLTGIAQELSTLTIHLKDLDGKKGKVYVALYNSEDTFLKKILKGEIVEIKEGKAVAVFKNLPNGTYAASSFFDKNNNGKLDANFIGAPKEPIAISNNVSASFGPPKFKDAKFKLDSDKTIEMNF